MLTKQGLDFILRLTDFFHGHWEDPEWGKRATTQVVVALAVHELADGMEDAKLRGQVQALTQEVIAKNSRAVVSG